MPEMYPPDLRSHGQPAGCALWSGASPDFLEPLPTQAPRLPVSLRLNLAAEDVVARLDRPLVVDTRWILFQVRGRVQVFRAATGEFLFDLVFSPDGSATRFEEGYGHPLCTPDPQYSARVAEYILRRALVGERPAFPRFQAES